ncbi:MAG: hypothetical protein V1495_10730 [Pseudomonadota bacterium]
MTAIRNFRLVPALDRSPRLHAAAQTWWGKVASLILFGALLWVVGFDWWLECTALLFYATFFPFARRWVLVIGSLTAFLHNNYVRSYFERYLSSARLESELGRGMNLSVCLFLGSLLVTFGIAWAFSRLKNRGLKYPFAWFLLFLFGLVVFASTGRMAPELRIVLWALILVLSRYAFYIGYTTHEARLENPTPFFFQLGYYYPFWCGTYLLSFLPIFKGAGHLRRIECKSPEESAVARLKAIKLLIWAAWVMLFRDLWIRLLYGTPVRTPFLNLLPGSLHVPSLMACLLEAQKGAPYPPLTEWMAVISSNFTDLLNITVKGGVMIGACRMAGFNALRVTYKVLYARTFVEYWNRYTYYFKELMADLFFYPAFLRCFRGHRKFRIFFAVLAAATFGNCLLHLLWDIGFVFELGLRRALVSFVPYILYASIIGTVIGVSYLRTERQRALPRSGWFRREVLSRVLVLGFMLHLWPIANWTPQITLQDYGRFFLSLWGIR